MRIGEQVWAETPTGRVERMRIAGTVRDPGRQTALVSGVISGYVTVATLPALGEPDLKVGDQVVPKIGGKESHWQVVGFVRKVLGEPLAYVNQGALAGALGEQGYVTSLQVVTAAHDTGAQARAASALRSRFKEQGLFVAATQTTEEVRQVQETRFSIVLIFLMLMAVLLAIVAGLGLTGTMSLSVLERTREIGIMRTIGATDGSLFLIVVAEGVMIGLISWVFAALLAVPISKQLSDAVGMAIFQSPLDYRFPASGLWAWLGLVSALSAAASLLPAWSAARLALREILAYE